jgi:hypothetical protein
MGLEGGEGILLKAIPKISESKSKAVTGYILQASSQPVLYDLPVYFFETLDVEDSKFAVEPPAPAKQ